MSGNIGLLSDAEILKSIINISEWLQSYSHCGPPDKKKVSIEDLAIGVPGECLFPELALENEEASREEERGILVFTDSREEKLIWLNENWHHLEKVLDARTNKAGWVVTANLGERLLMLILTQLDYAAKESEAEVPYGCCPIGDPAYLLWQNNRPAGMCSLKRKGTSIWGGEDRYICDTLDTLYVRPSFRRQGHTVSLLLMLTSQLPPGEHLALSHPISMKMCKVLLKFLQVYPSLRDTLWTLDEDGEVSGTVLLMLGSLMVRGILPTPSSAPAICNERKDNYPFITSGAPISNKISPSSSSSSSSLQCKGHLEVEDQRMSS